MLSNTLRALTLATLVSLPQYATAEVHGASAVGTMGPVAFLWPEDRPWSADFDNIAPCGSNAPITNRTSFPMSKGAVSLSISEEAFHVAFRMAYGNNPTLQTEFTTEVVHDVVSVAPGHQCYPVPKTPSEVTSGTNATIQLEYYSKYEDGPTEKFYACADVTLIDAEVFTTTIPCFNVTSAEFELPASSTPSSVAAPSAATGTTTTTESKGSGISTGALAGAIVGATLGGLLIFSLVGFFIWRKVSANKKQQSEQFPAMGQKNVAPSLASADTRV
ncbi:uncharacterized protein BP5553_01098 [Venustampulla echinocandica]|uniref:Copper acquisition factor BIM1-like domain-containing protein n=1 Tax=Venustampulla echinocandica TaxID=2656787 RepID=A0A370U019_9HELO|nr:uncharacterized protein BP5553_01098 [Venustampulla echinocandica]RDL41119.1 hypothetical protein BP5553_01098 [Venustampulla echinocandica]